MAKVTKGSKVVLLALLIMCNTVLGQERVYSETEVDQKAVFPFGEDSLKRFIQKNMVWADSNVSVKGTVIVRFVVNKVGEIKSPQISRSNFWKAFEQEAIRLVSIMSKWHPALIDNRKVSSQVELPIIFQLEQ